MFRDCALILSSKVRRQNIAIGKIYFENKLLTLHIHGEQHVKKFYSTVAIDNRGHALKPVRGYSFTGEDTNIFYPWLLKNGVFFNISIYISFMRTLI